MDLLTPMKALEACSMAIGMIGVFLVSWPKIQGLYLINVAQIGWFIFALVNGFEYLAVQAVILVILNTVGIYNWRRKNVG